jgi:RNA methyltransferase, TrmH family
MAKKQMIASVHNRLVSHLVNLRQNRKYREEHGAILISGYKLVKELAEKQPPRRIFVEDLDVALPGYETVQVSHAVLKKITNLPSPEPIAAEFSLPLPSSLKNRAPLLVLDAIQDPGNLGTLLRTALAFGWAAVFFLPNCVDPFSEKVVRASRAALFQLPWKIGTWEELLDLKEKEKLLVYVADIEGKDFKLFQPNKKIMLLLSNEAQGISQMTEKLGEKITIPMEGKMESLNVAIAGAILMYQLVHG